MKKIIVAFDGLKLSESALQYAITLGRQHESHLVGVFLDDLTYTSYALYEAFTEKEFSYEKLRKLGEKDRATRDAAVWRFEEACRKAGLHYSIHRDKDIAITELLHESTYADILIIDVNETLTHYTEAPPTRFIRDLLSRVQCPVWLTPKHFSPVKKVVFLYDGAPSSVYAVKMFSYLLPVLNALPAEVITVKVPGNGLHLPDNKLMKEFMKRHSPHASYTVCSGDAEREIIEHLRKQGEDVLVVLGAYQRGTVSRWFRQSMADALAKELEWPLFIAHQ